MNLRRMLVRSGIGLVAVTLIACSALVLMTTLLRHNVDALIQAQREAGLASDLVGHSLSYAFETSPEGRAMAEARGRVTLAKAVDGARTPEQKRRFAELVPLLERQWQTPATAGNRLPKDLILAVSRTKEAFRDNLEAKEKESRRLDELSNAIGLSCAALLALGVLLLMWLVRTFAFRPINAIARSVDRFASGDEAARAPEEGANEIRRIAHVHNEMADALARARQDQLRYIATVVHDLRNPLAAVQLAVGYVSPDRPLPPETRIRELFGLFRRQLQRMNSLVGDVLGAVQIDAGLLVLRKGPCDVAELAREALALFQGMSPSHRFRFESDGPSTIFADERRLEQVLNNLLSNAAKYSPPGSLVTLSIEGDATTLSISVSDQGRGIPPELRQQVFQPFVRGASAHEEISGVGLGLYVSRQIVEAHGGRLDVESREGEGSTFRLVLPRESLPVRPEDASAAPVPGSADAAAIEA